MSTLPEPGWRHLGATANAEVYEVDDDLLAIVPHPDSRDDEATARARSTPTRPATR